MSGSSAYFLPLLGAVGTAIAWVCQRARESREKQFATFHKLVKELVSPAEKDEKMWLDRQIAVAFELRHFRRYYDVTERILNGVKTTWEEKPDYARLIDEIKLTLDHIANRPWRRFQRLLNQSR